MPRTKLQNSILLVLMAAALSGSAYGDDAPGSPGLPHTWEPSRKDAVGTAYEGASGANSPVWFTLSRGIVTEVFYPTVDLAQLSRLHFAVTDGAGYFSDQLTGTASQVSFADEGMAVHVSGAENSGRYSFTQTIVTDPQRAALLIQTTLHFNHVGDRLFILADPSIGNSGTQSLGTVSSQALTTSGKLSALAIAASSPWVNSSVGYVGSASDPSLDLSQHFQLTAPWVVAGPGNLTLAGELATNQQADFTYELAVGFGPDAAVAASTASASLAQPFATVQSSYEAGWKAYLAGLASSTEAPAFLKSNRLARHSAQLIKMHEDKSHRGAIIASLSTPGIPGPGEAGDGAGGYHLIWPRDLYHAAMGLIAAGDVATAQAILGFYESSQRADGSWAQNFWLSGVPFWNGLQMDECSFPTLLALKLRDVTGVPISNDALNMVRKAATFVSEHGPVTPEDRWEEIGGYVPDTLAVEIAGLQAASQLLGDSSLAATAAQWRSQIESWTFANTGVLGSDYYLRVSQSGKPNDAETIQLANSAGSAVASSILDGGFLELVRFGIRPASDPGIVSTLGLYESPASGLGQADPKNPDGFIYKRYTRDGYGPGNVAGYWPLLGGERGVYAIAAQDPARASAELSAVESSASATGMIPEQVVRVDGSQDGAIGLEVASPLVWAHAEHLVLLRSIEEDKVFDQPGISF